MIVEGEFFLDDGLQQALLSENFSWFYAPESSSYQFPFVVHTALSRLDGGARPTSDTWEYIKSAVEQFCDKNQIEVRRYLRAAFNMTFAAPAGYPRCDMHIDQAMTHFVLVAYINDDCSGDTIIFDKKLEVGDIYTPPTIFVDEPDVPEKHRVSPKKNWAVCFDGLYYHAAEFCKVGERRVVLVVNFVGERKKCL